MDRELQTRITTALSDPNAPWYGSSLVADVADLLEQHDRLHAKAATAVESYDGNGEDWFNELMEDLGREVHGSE